MIITTQKPLEEIEKHIESFNKLIIIGCSECAAICQTGGSEQVKEMAETLEEKGKEILATLMIDSPCDERITKRDIKLIEDELKEADAILVMTCGLGAQSIGKITQITYVPALNTKFYGRIERLGRYFEDCCGCETCVLFENDGKCPVVTRKVCKDCGRVLKYDSKFCDMCKSDNLEVKEPQVLIINK